MSASRTGSGPSRSSSCLRFSPATYSKTMYCRPASSPRSITVTMFGWLSWATERASRRKRSTYSSSVVNCSWRTLIATVRSNSRSSAFQTLDIPPRPISSRSSYRPAIRSPVDTGVKATAALTEDSFERRFPDRERLVQLGVAERQRRQHADAVGVDPGLDQQQSALRGGIGDGGGERWSGGLRRRIGHELDREHRAEAADVADVRPALLPGEHARPYLLAEERCPRAEILLRDHVQHRERGSLRYRIADVGAADRGIRRRVHDLATPDHAGERQPHRDRLRDRDQVGLDAVVLDPEELPGAGEAALDLVHDHYDPVLVAEMANALHELLRSDHEATLALHRLDHDRRDGLSGDLRDERALERGECAAGAGAAVLVWEGHAVDLRRERAEPRLVRVRLRRHRQAEQRPPVEAALERDHGRALRVRARELDRVLDGLGPGVEERRLRVRHRRELAQPLGQVDVGLVRDDREVGVAEALQLVLCSLDHARVRMPDVETADAACEVDEGVAVDVGQCGALAALDHDGKRQ